MTRTNTSTGIPHRVAKALSHPMRHQILAILNKRVASPNEIATELDEPLGNVSYHVRMLQKLECVELVRTAQKRGAVEHFYRATERPYFDDRAWGRLPESTRYAITDQILRLIWDDVAASVRERTFDARDDSHVSRNPLVVDEEGWDELKAIALDACNRAMQVETESASRLAQSGEEGIAARFVVMHFEAGTSKPSQDGKPAETAAAAQAS